MDTKLLSFTLKDAVLNVCFYVTFAKNQMAIASWAYIWIFSILSVCITAFGSCILTVYP